LKHIFAQNLAASSQLSFGDGLGFFIWLGFFLWVARLSERTESTL